MWNILFQNIFSIKNLQSLCKDFEFFFEGKNPFDLKYLHSSNPCQKVKYFDNQNYTALFYYSIIELILAAFVHFSLEMVPLLLWEHKHVQIL